MLGFFKLLKNTERNKTKHKLWNGVPPASQSLGKLKVLPKRLQECCYNTVQLQLQKYQHLASSWLTTLWVCLHCQVKRNTKFLKTFLGRSCRRGNLEVLSLSKPQACVVLSALHASVFASAWSGSTAPLILAVWDSAFRACYVNPHNGRKLLIVFAFLLYFAFCLI